jgi:hypothetical protein
LTNQEFAKFIDRMFIAFPSLHEWLQGTYKPEETQRLWRTTLSPYTLDECLSVITRWTTGVLKPFAAYEKDQVHLLVRSICEMDRDRQHKRKSQSEANRPYHQKRKAGGTVQQVGTGAMMDSAMVAAVKEGAAHHRRLLDGEITQVEFERLRDEVLAKHGI